LNLFKENATNHNHNDRYSTLIRCASAGNAGTTNVRSTTGTTHDGTATDDAAKWSSDVGHVTRRSTSYRRPTTSCNHGTTLAMLLLL